MANAKINIEIREMLLGHKIGLSNSYYRPTVEEMLNEYLEVVNDLTIDPAHRLQKQVQELKEKDEYKNYLIEQKLKNLENENQNLKQEIEKSIQSNDFSDIREQLSEIRKQMRLNKNKNK